MDKEQTETIHETIGRLNAINERLEKALAESEGSFKKCLFDLEKQVMESNGDIQKVIQLIEPLVQDTEPESEEKWYEALYPPDLHDTCPVCQDVGEEVDDMEYECPNCGSQWHFKKEEPIPNCIGYRMSIKKWGDLREFYDWEIWKRDGLPEWVKDWGYKDTDDLEAQMFFQYEHRPLE